MARPRDTSEEPLGSPSLELELPSQPAHRAEQLLHAQDRVRGLLQANRAVVAKLDLKVVLRKIVEAACDLVDAPYGALGVIAPTGTGLEAFVNVGLDEETVGRIGHLPEGKGLLGVLIEQPDPVRLTELQTHPRSVGFPDGHPEMKAFLGVPVPVRGAPYGNLYLTRPDKREFSQEDEDLVVALAATAGVAIENARLFEESRRRQDWLEASTEVTRQLLTDSGAGSLREIARQVARLAEADITTLVLPAAEAQFEIAVAEGPDASPLQGLSYPMAGTVSQHVLRTGEAVCIDTVGDLGDLGETAEGMVRLAETVAVGPVMVLPLMGAERVRGTLVVGRAPGRRPFTDAETGMATTFANHAALALELADVRADQQRMLLLDDRSRIARDLHDHVIQQLYASGLTVQGVVGRLGDHPAVGRLEEVIGELDDAIRQIRASIFQLRLQEHTGLRSAVLAVVTEMRSLLGSDPQVGFTGPVDSVVDGPLTDDVTAVVREMLSNVARHASASRIVAEVRASRSELCITVADDGVGPGSSSRRSGLGNLQARAERRGGHLVTGQGFGGRGLRVDWSVPLP